MAQTRPPSLKTVSVPIPSNFSDAVLNADAAKQLGKALFWDMQVGSDGVQACASCHFHAGADHRTKNQINPGPLNQFSLMQSGERGPNCEVTSADFPLHRLVVPDDNASPVAFDSDDRFSSQGVFRFLFTGITPGNTFDNGTQELDPANFFVSNVNVRRVEPRNTPTVINSVFFVRLFHDGRANNTFNGVNPFGNTDPSAKVLVRQNGTVVPVTVAFDHGALASQADGPPGSGFEMSHDGRTFADIGRKLLALRPLNGQLVALDDSVLGSLSAFPLPGLGAASLRYTDLIKSAFQPKYWDQDGDGDPTNDTADFGGFTQMEKNMSLFFGLSVLAYERTLVSDNSRYDQFMEAGGVGNLLTAQEKEGLDIFLNRGRCIDCHAGPEFAGGTFTQIAQTGLLRRIVLANGLRAVVDNGFVNIGVRPTAEDLGVGTNGGPNGTPFSLARRAKLGENVDGGALQPPVGANERIAVDGAFKIPTMRNIELTGPYMHNGGFATLEQVVDFYSGGAHFEVANNANLAPRVTGIGGMDATRKAALVAFLKTLTDERVRLEQAPFDHPQLIIPNGQQGDENAVVPEDAFRAKDDVLVIDAVGQGGRAANAALKDFESSLPTAIAALSTGPMTVLENGTNTAFGGLVLGKRPTSNVRIDLSVSDATEGRITPASMTFTPTNWNVVQIIRIKGVQDFVVDGNQDFFVVTSAAISADPQYSGLAVRDIKATTIDSGVH